MGRLAQTIGIAGENYRQINVHESQTQLASMAQAKDIAFQAGGRSQLGHRRELAQG